MNKKTASWLLLILLAFIWGSSFILMEKAMFTTDKQPLLSANQVGALRILIAAIAVLPITIKHFRLLFSKYWIYLILVGLLGNLLPAFLFPHAEQYLSSSFTGMLNSLVPIFSLLVSVFIFRNSISKQGIIGVGIGFVGSLLLIMFKDNDLNGFSYFGTALIIAATMCYALSLNIIKEKLNGISSMQITALSLFTMIPGSFATLLWEGNISEIFQESNHYPLLYTTILAVVGTALALILFNNLIKASGAVFASSVTYLIPFVAILWGWYFNEAIGWSTLFIFLIIGGIYLVKKEKS